MSKYSDFWFDRQTEVNDFLATIGKDDDAYEKPKPKKDHMGLAGHKRAIGNFVRIVSGKNIPVKFMTRGDSFTDGKTVTISSRITEKNFDETVGLALHEGSHIAYSDFEVFKEVRNLTKIRNWDLTSHPERMEFLRSMINYIEDRRIDNIVFKSSPGYKGYYHTLYSKFFNHKKMGKGLKSKMYRDVDFESYMFRIVNFTNPDTDLNALPRLLDIYRLINMSNIDRLKSTDDAIEVAKSVCDVVFKLVDENKGAGKQNGEGEEDTEGEEENGSSSNNGGNGTEVDSGDKEMTPEDGEATEGEEISDSMRKSVESIYKKTKELLDGKSPKSKMTKNDKKIVDALGNSNSELVEVGGTEGLNKTKVVVVPDLTQALIDSSAFHFLYSHSYSYNSSKEDAINDGLRLGAILGKKLKVRGEEKDLIYTRQTSGKINKRLIAELGFDNGNVFSQVFTERYNKANLHISIDASGSMHGNKLQKSITSAVAMVKAAEMAGNIHVVVSFRWTQDDKPVVIICYDSRKDKITKIKKLWKYINAGGTTPESLCYEALMKKWLGGVNGDDNYFINYSDGAPWFSNNEIYYSGTCAEKHTRKMVKMMKNNGIKIASYFINEGSYGSQDTKHVFTRMYGKDASFINPTNMMEVAKSMNSKFLEK